MLYIQGGAEKTCHLIFGHFWPYLRQLLADFQNFFHGHTLGKIYDNVIIVDPTTP